MAPKKSTIDRQAVYRVGLTRSIKVGRTPIHAGPNVKLRGDVLDDLIASDPDAVSFYEPAKVIEPAKTNEA